MKPAPFEQTEEFRSFAESMKRLIAVPKAEMNALIRKHEADSQRNRIRKATKKTGGNATT